MTERLTDEALQALVREATPGPWGWEVNKSSKRVELCGGRQSKAGGDLTAMSFGRWGLQGAAPLFWTWRGHIADEPRRADELSIPAAGREHHADWFARIEHPTANLIALAPTLAAEVLELRARVAAADTLASTLEIWKEEPRNCSISKALQGYLTSAPEASA